MRLTDILLPQAVLVPMAEDKKERAIAVLVDALAAAGEISDGSVVLKAVMDREAVLSTGVGDGVAIPHARSEGAPRLCAALGITAAPIESDAIDKQPVQLVWLLVGPPGNTGPHLKALSRISRLMHQTAFRAELAAARSPETALTLITDAEERLNQLAG